MSNLISYDRFMAVKVLKWEKEELISRVLSVPNCPYTPLLVRSRTREQLVQFLIDRAKSQPVDHIGGSNEEVRIWSPRNPRNSV
jgi:hypothetical protein